MLEALRRRAQQTEEVNLHCRFAACVAEEAIAATHVRMALETAEVLAEGMSPDEAIMHYVRSFSLPWIEAHVVFQRTMARWADGHSTGLEAEAGARESAARPASRAPALAPLGFPVTG